MKFSPENAASMTLIQKTRRHKKAFNVYEKKKKTTKCSTLNLKLNSKLQKLSILHQSKGKRMEKENKYCTIY